MKKLVYEIKKLCQHNRDGSFETQRKRLSVLTLASKQLAGELGFQHMGIHSLKPKHIQALVKLWQSQNLSTSTLKGRMSQLRWWASKVNKKNVVSQQNEVYGIERRVYSNQGSKAVVVTEAQLQNIDDPHVRASVMLARAFGLRKEEAIKVIPRIADEGNCLYLKPSWCKGGRERRIPIRNDQQRAALDYAHRAAGPGSLIPAHLNYIQQRRRYEKLTLGMGLKRLHGLRHHYAQTRYRELTGWECPCLGGPHRRELTEAQCTLDEQARTQITQELGHNRLQVLVNYLH